MNPMMIYQGVQAVAAFAEKKKLAREKQARYEANRIAAVGARDLKISALTQRAVQESEVVADDKMALAIKALETRESQPSLAGAVLDFAGQAMASDIKYGDGKMFGVNLTGNKDVANLTSGGFTKSTFQPMNTSFSLSTT